MDRYTVTSAKNTPVVRTNSLPEAIKYDQILGGTIIDHENGETHKPECVGTRPCRDPECALASKGAHMHKVYETIS